MYDSPCIGSTEPSDRSNHTLKYSGTCRAIREKIEIVQQIETAKRLRTLMRSGDFYRIASPYAGNDCAWQVVSKDKRETVLLFARILSVPNPNVTTVKLKGLLPGENYHESGSQRIYGGDELMYMGIHIETGAQDYFSILKHLIVI